MLRARSWRDLALSPDAVSTQVSMNCSMSSSGPTLLIRSDRPRLIWINATIQPWRDSPSEKVAEAFMSEPGSPQLYHRGLWSSVVLQPIEEIEKQLMQSIAFDEAVAFFSGSGSWAESRTMIGDFLELHRDDLATIGQRCIDARVNRE